MDKEYKYIKMAEVIRDNLLTFKEKKSIVRLTAKETRKLDGMDKYANNSCYNNVGRAMEYVILFMENKYMEQKEEKEIQHMHLILR